MKRSSQNSEKEAWALRAIFDAMFRVGISATNVEEAEQAIELAAILLSYMLRRRVKPSEVRARIEELMEEADAADAETATRH